MATSDVTVVILAAGLGTRMRSELPKVLQPLSGKPLLHHALQAVESITQHIIVVCGYGMEKVIAACRDFSSVQCVEQKEQLGTAHAVMQALPFIPKDHRVLVLCGDVPLITEQTLRHFLSAIPENVQGWLTASVPDPTGFGRIIRDDKQQVIAIVEHKDATEEQRLIKEMNSGICVFPPGYLETALHTIQPHNQQGEYYLTDLLKHALHDKLRVSTDEVFPWYEVQGVNNKNELAQLERRFQMNKADELMKAGVTLIDPNRFDLRGELQHGKDVTIDVNVILEGNNVMGNRCHIGANVILKNVTLGDDVTIHPFTHIENATIANECVVGPFARLRPETELEEGAKVGNFVEIKKSKVGPGSKVNHLSYVGDATIGKGVNVGAGTITCNYDGVNKFKTIIHDDAFIGSNTSLVAPITIGEGATVAAGSVVSKCVPKDQLTVARARQQVIDNWKRPIKTHKE